MSDILDQEIYAITTILESIQAKSACLPRNSRPRRAAPPPEKPGPSHLFVPEANTAAAVSTVLTAQGLKLYVAIEDNRDPFEIQDMRTNTANAVAAEHYAVRGHWLESASKGTSKFTHETYARYFQEALPKPLRGDPFLLTMGYAEYFPLAYLFCAPKLEQVFLWSKAIPGMQDSPTMIDVLCSIRVQNIANHFMYSLDDVDVNTPKRKLFPERELLSYIHSHDIPSAAFSGYTLSYTSREQIWLWQVFIRVLLDLNRVLWIIRDELSRAHGDKVRLYEEGIVPLIETCVNLTYLLKCKSFYRLLQNPALSAEHQEKEFFAGSLDKLMEYHGGNLDPRSIEIEDMEQIEYNNAGHDSNVSSSARSRALTLITSWLERCIRIDNALDRVMRGPISEISQSRGLQIHLLDSPTSYISPLSISPLMQHLDESQEHESSLNTFRITEELHAAFVDKFPSAVEYLNSSGATQKRIHAQSSLGVAMNVMYDQKTPLEIDVSHRCCFCCSWLLFELGLQQSVGYHKICAWIPPPDLAIATKELLLGELRRLLIEQISNN